MSSTSVGVCDLLPAFWSRNPCFSSMCFPFAEIVVKFLPGTLNYSQTLSFLLVHYAPMKAVNIKPIFEIE